MIIVMIVMICAQAGKEELMNNDYNEHYFMYI